MTEKNNNIQKLEEALSTDENLRNKYDHDGFCLTTWHCATAFLHTDTDSKKVMCWSNYLCVAINN